MKNITEQFNRRFEPQKALLIYGYEGVEDETGYARARTEDEIYVESYDIGRNGRPINAHPLTLKEMQQLAALFAASQKQQTDVLRSKGVIPSQVLYVQQQGTGFAVWHTPPQEVDLFFADDLNVPCGKAQVPGMIWKGTTTQVQVFAVKSKGRPTVNTALYHAPFLNIYGNGQVCMGTVKIDITANTCLEGLMAAWQQYFFNSYFTHSINGNSSTKSDTVELWRNLRKTATSFPLHELLPNGLTLKSLLQ